MKVKLLVCACVIMVCLTAYAQQNNTVWKATLNYCISKEQNDAHTFDYLELQKERSDIYNFKISNQTGSLKSVISLIYDSVSRGIIAKYPTRLLDSDLFIGWTEIGFTDGISEYVLYSGTFGENGFAKGNKIIIDTSKITNRDVKGLMMNREWMYNLKEHKLSVKCTDAVLMYFYPWNNYPDIFGGLRFVKRSNASLGLNQEVCQPEIVWCRNMPLPLVSSSIDTGNMYIYKTFTKGDTCTKYPYHILNGKSTTAFCGFNTQVKTTFDKTLVDWIWDEARNGSLECYASDSGNIGKKLTRNEVLKAGSSIDTLIEENGGVIPVLNEVDSTFLDGLAVKEDISFNKKTFRFESTISYVGLILKVPNNNTGKYFGNHEILYWVKFKD